MQSKILRIILVSFICFPLTGEENSSNLCAEGYIKEDEESKPVLSYSLSKAINEKQVKDILHFGAEKASKVAESVLDRVRSAAGIGYF